jgi:hypothetical protein
MEEKGKGKDQVVGVPGRNIALLGETGCANATHIWVNDGTMGSDAIHVTDGRNTFSIRAARVAALGAI